MKPAHYPAILLILLLSGALRLWHLGDASLWIDEIVTAERAQGPFSDALGSILGAGNQVPLYYLLLRPWPAGNELLLRLPSALAGMIGVALLMRIAARLYRDQRLALWSGALLATNPYHVWLSRTARPYALLFVLGLLAVYLFLRLEARPDSRARWLTFTASSAAAYLTHYFALLLPLTQAAHLSRRRPDRVFRAHWLRAQMTAGLPLALWLGPLVLIDLGTDRTLIGAGIARIPAPGPGDLPRTLWNLGTGTTGDGGWLVLPGVLAVTVGLLGGAARTIRGPGHPDRYWLLLVAGALAGVLIASWLVRPVYVDRYFIILLPGVLLLMLRGWPRYAWAVAVILTGLGLVAWTLQTGRDEKIDWRASAAHLHATVTSGDGLLLDPATTRDPLATYWPGGTLDGVPLFEIADDSADPQPVDDAPAEPVRTLWAIVPQPRSAIHRQGALPGFDLDDSALGRWLLRHESRIVTERRFNGVRLYRLAYPASQQMAPP